MLDEFPLLQTDFHHAKPVYEELPGWSEDLRECETWQDLPQTARDYVQYIAEFTKTRVKFIAVGPGRDEALSSCRGASAAAAPSDRRHCEGRGGPPTGASAAFDVSALGSDGRDHDLARAAGEADLVAVGRIGEAARREDLTGRRRPRGAGRRRRAGSRRRSSPREPRCRRGGAEGPRWRRPTHALGRCRWAGSVTSMSLAPPVTSRRVTRSAERSAASLHMPPRREMSQGTAVESVKSADWARQSNGRKRRRCCTTTVPPVTVISGAGPTNVAWYRSVSDGSPFRDTFAAPLVNSRRPAEAPPEARSSAPACPCRRARAPARP